MTVTELTSAADHQAWDVLVAGHPHTGFMQSWRWSEFKELENYQVIRLGLWEAQRLVGGALFYGYPTPMETLLWAVPDGPVLDWGQPQQWDALRDAFLAHPAAQSANILRVEPRMPLPPDALKSFPRSPTDLVPMQTLEIPLGSEQDMLDQMKPKGRYNARLALRKGVEVAFSSDPTDIADVYFVLDQTARYQKFDLEPHNFFMNLACTYLPRNEAELVLARYHGMTLAVAVILYHGDRVTYLYGGHLPILTTQMATYALHWEIMRRAVKRGMRRYDLYGYVGPEQINHPYYHFSRFKEKLGGVPVVRMGSRDILFYDRLVDVVAQNLNDLEKTV